MKNNKKHGFTLIELLVVFAIIAIVLGMIVGGLKGHGISISDGKRKGSLTKFSHKGLFIKSWEGQLNLGGLIQTDHGSIANTWNFSVLDNKVAEEINGYMESNVVLQLTYHQSLFVNPLVRNTSYEVTKVEVVK